MEEFRKLGIIEPILKSIEAQKFAEPSEIQNKAIPLVLQGKDVIAGSATGSGKTLVFGARIIQNSEQARGIQSLVLTPTRELAIQVAESLSTFSRFKRLNIISVYGGVSINPQIDKLRTADVVVGTPGRILDHAQRRTIDLRRVNVLVLDEADRMLDMGFIDDVERIIRLCPAKRQTLLFSATISSEIAGLAGRYMINPVRVSVEQYVDPKKLKQVYYDAPDNLKFSLLVHLLRNERGGLAMVFCNTQRNTDFVARNLKLNGLKVMAIHGGFSQAKRTRTMEQFHSQDVQVLVCTDVAARGLDIKGVTHIYNYDIPVESKQYIHRIGRTARAGEEGKAINILAHRDHDNFTRVLRDEDVKIEAQAMPYVERARINIPSRGERFVRHGRDFRNPRHSRNFGQSSQVRRGFRSTARA